MSTPNSIVVLPCGPGASTALDTLESIEHYCVEPHDIVVVDDHTDDGTYETLLKARMSNWHVLRNARPFGTRRLVHTLCMAYKYALDNLHGDLIFRLDQDALVIREGVLGEARDYMRSHASVGLFGVYEVDYNRPRNFTSHREKMNKEMLWWRRLAGFGPSWQRVLHLAEMNGYERGANVFGGAYFLTRDCLRSVRTIGGLDVPYRWNSKLDEDVYFSMAAVAAGYRMGHFAAPTGPLCLEWRGLPFPALDCWEKGYKVVHSVDKGLNCCADENGGYSAREVFRRIRSGLYMRQGR